MITLRELAVISLFTDTMLLEGDDMGHLYMVLEKYEGRPVHTHEIPKLSEKHREKLKIEVKKMYDMAKAHEQYEKILEEESKMFMEAVRRNLKPQLNALTEPPKPASCPFGNKNDTNGTCDVCNKQEVTE